MIEYLLTPTFTLWSMFYYSTRQALPRQETVSQCHSEALAEESLFSKVLIP